MSSVETRIEPLEKLPWNEILLLYAGYWARPGEQGNSSEGDTKRQNAFNLIKVAINAGVSSKAALVRRIEQGKDTKDTDELSSRVYDLALSFVDGFTPHVANNDVGFQQWVQERVSAPNNSPEAMSESSKLIEDIVKHGGIRMMMSFPPGILANSGFGYLYSANMAVRDPLSDPIGFPSVEYFEAAKKNPEAKEVVWIYPVVKREGANPEKVLDVKYGSLVNGEDRGEENTVVIAYEIPAKRGRWEDYSGRSGQLLQMTVVLPQSRADKFRTLLEKDSAVIRKVLEAVHRKFFQGQVRPDLLPPFLQEGTKDIPLIISLNRDNAPFR